MIRLSNLCLVCLAVAGASLQARAATVAIEPVRDGTLYESATGDLANGAGDYLFSGTTAGVELRRAVFAFDVADALPAGSTVTIRVSKGPRVTTPNLTVPDQVVGQ